MRSSSSLIELRHLRYFVAVAENLSFHRAATQLNLSQQQVSQTISSLEQIMGSYPKSVKGAGRL